MIIIASLWFLGPFVTGLEYAADCKAEVVGKPEKAFFLSAVEEFQCQPNECIMIGDVIHWILLLQCVIIILALILSYKKIIWSLRYNWCKSQGETFLKGEFWMGGFIKNLKLI